MVEGLALPQGERPSSLKWLVENSYISETLAESILSKHELNVTSSTPEEEKGQSRPPLFNEEQLAAYFQLLAYAISICAQCDEPDIEAIRKHTAEHVRDSRSPEEAKQHFQRLKETLIKSHTSSNCCPN